MLNWGSHVVEEECQRVACAIALKAGNLLHNRREGIEQDLGCRFGRCIGAAAGDAASAPEA